MKLNKLIKEKYGSVDNMIKETGTKISRAYLYKIISGDKSNITVEIAQELQKILELSSIDELLELLNDDSEEV